MKRIVRMTFMVLVSMLLFTNHGWVQSPAKWQVSQAWAYVQFQSAEPDGYTLRRFRPMLVVANGHWRGLVELQIGLTNTLVRAQCDYWMHSVPVFDPVAIRGGQFTNMMLFLEQSPDTKHFVTYALDDHYITNQYDIGATLIWVKGKTLGQLQLVNGAGRSVPDNNRQQDVIAYLKIRPVGWLTCEAGMQTGHQPDGYRLAAYMHVDLHPVSAWTVQAGLVAKKHVTENRGWYLSSLYDLTHAVRLTGRAVQRTQWKTATLAGQQVTDDFEYTAGLELKLGPLRLQPNLILAYDRDPELAGVAQLNIVLK